MKKFLGLSALWEKDVPQKLDATVLAYAAIAARRRKLQKRFRIASGIAAMFCFGAGLAFTIFPKAEVRPEFSQAELLAMNDFTTFEQENYAIGIMSAPEELTIDNYI